MPAGSLEAYEGEEEPLRTEAERANGGLVRRVRSRTESYEFKGMEGQEYSRRGWERILPQGTPFGSFSGQEMNQRSLF